MPVVKNDKAPVAAGHVRIGVRARGSVAFPWAGHLWPIESVTYDAHPNEVRDFLAAPPSSLMVSWPDDYVAPDGSMPGRVVVAAVHETNTAPTSIEDRLAIAERDATRAKGEAIAAEREMSALRSTMAAAARDKDQLVAEAVERSRSLALSVQEAEQRAVAAVEKLAQTETEVAATIERIRREHRGVIDTMEAKHAEEIAQVHVERERLTASVVALTTEIDKLTSPAPAAPTTTSAPAKKKTAADA